MLKVFNGRGFAEKKEKVLVRKVGNLRRKGVIPKLSVVIVGEDPASQLYVRLKKKVAERIGVAVEVYEVDESGHDVSFVVDLIKGLNDEADIHGILLQLPLPENFKSKTGKIIRTINKNKDVDGLREDSPYLHPTSKAVIQIMNEAKVKSGVVAVVGANGMVGKPLVNELTKMGFEVDGLNSKSDNFSKRVKGADIVVSATGVSGLIENVKRRAVVIDVGSPKGDVEFKKVSKQARFITPVPGGVGPVTITCLLENLVEAAYNTFITHT